MSQKFFCSMASSEQGEPLPGLGNPFARLLLMRAPRGDWRAMRERVVSGEGRLGEAIKGAIASRSRVLFVDSADPEAVPALVSYPDAAAVRSLDSDVEVEDMAVAWCGGTPLGGAPEPRIVILCCTDGKTDPCCARFGMATYKALVAHADPNRFAILQSSHLGGCRFATTLVTLPDNARYGRLTPDQVPAFLDALAAGVPYLPALRGIGPSPEAVQVATVGAMRWAADRGMASAVIEVHDEGLLIADDYGMKESDPPDCEVRISVGGIWLVALLRRARFPILDDCSGREATYRHSTPRWVLEALRAA